jgi:hypothetical protein
MGGVNGLPAPRTPSRSSGGAPRVWDALEPYAIMYVAAFLSALSGFMLGAGMGAQAGLHGPDADVLGG